ncbi:MAG: hypothetical protein HZB11_00880 [Candidatus Yonathbacteria bacterium]|nr:hypothetical protein [Candidatus Yonathbacteria bacterium]
MQGIEFEEDKNFSGLSKTAPQALEAKPSLMMKLLERIGVVDKTTANFILLGVAAIFFGVTIFLYARTLVEPAKDWSLDEKVILEAQRLRP